ncbi:hypothetical protein Trydic_g9575 [Trypoxylus dichotomus]
MPTLELTDVGSVVPTCPECNFQESGTSNRHLQIDRARKEKVGHVAKEKEQRNGTATKRIRVRGGERRIAESRDDK